jgi:methionyl-tRNA synthetase
MSHSNRLLITSALPYINGVKHLGNLAGSMLPADVYSRFQRQRRGVDNVLFLCATDEHGTPAELAALAEGKSTREYCDYWHGVQADLCKQFCISFDHFGRSSSEQNRVLTQRFARTLWEQGYLEQRVTKQFYSQFDDRFLPDRYIVGTCPHCGYDRARGDQCENCTRVLDSADLINPRSAVSGSSQIEIRDSKHLFLRQSAFYTSLREWIDGKAREWPELVTSIATKWLNEGIQDRGITRDLDWGIPVDARDWGPNPKGERVDAASLLSKVFYVWFDAPIEYMAATWEWANAKFPTRPDEADTLWQSWWRGAAAANVRYVQFMGKDNVPFHTIGFPCTVLGVNTQESEQSRWKLVDQLKGFNWLNYYGGKFSTSQKRGIFMDQALRLLPADYWRWYLIANAPESADSSFTWEHLRNTINKDLADVLGNFVNRVLQFAANRFGNTLPGGGALGPSEHALASVLTQKIGEYYQQMEAMQFRRSAATLRAIWSAGNEYVNSEAPWKVAKVDLERAQLTVRVAVNLIRIFALLAAPIIPQTAERMLGALRLSANLYVPLNDVSDELNALPAGAAFDVPDVLFVKLCEADVEKWKAEFGGDPSVLLSESPSVPTV